MRKFLIWFSLLFIVAVGAIIGAYFLAKKYEDPVREYIVAQVNKRLRAPVHVTDINFTLLERFPSASLVLDNVWAEEYLVKIGRPDTLFYFEKVYLNLNIFDIIDGQYKINAIEARDGFMRFLIDDEGFENYRIWKQGTDTTGFLLELDKVHLKNASLSYRNHSRYQYYDLLAHDLYFNGKFSSENYTMAVKGDGFVNEISIKETSYLRNRFVDVETDLYIVSSEERYTFKKGTVEIDNQLQFAIDGAFAGNGVDLRIKGINLDIINALALIPSESTKALAGYESSGLLTFDCVLKGAFGKTENPGLKAEFSFENAAITKKGSRWKLTGLTGSGFVSNGENKNNESTSLEITAISGNFNDDPFSAAFRVVYFLNPTIEGKAKIESDIQGVRKFFDLQLLEQAEGKFLLDAQISTTLGDPYNPKPSDFLNASAAGEVKIWNAKIKLKDDHRIFEMDTALFFLKNNALEIRDYKGNINNCAVRLSGRAEGFLGYFLTSNGSVDVQGKVRAGIINLDELFPAQSTENAGVVVAFPPRASWDLQVVADGFVQGDFSAKEISGRLLMDAFKVEASQLHFLSQGGNVSGRAGIYKFSQNQFGIRTDFSTDQVDIKALFKTFKNFDQQFITHESLEGLVDANIAFQAMCDSVLNINTQSIVATAELKISNGALVGFAPLISVADEIRRKPMLRMFIATDELKRRLEDVRFATLSNEISIRNGVITIPNMEIQSSAINLKASGTHTFSNDIDYSIDFAFSELLELKERTEPYNEYVQRDDNGRTRIYLTMKGTTDDFDVEIEKTDLQKNLKKEITDERIVVKGLLKEEFGAFQSDTSISPSKAQREALQFEFDPNLGTPNEKVDSNKLDEKGVNKKEKNLLNKLIKKTETDREKLKDGDFDDDDF